MNDRLEVTPEEWGDFERRAKLAKPRLEEFLRTPSVIETGEIEQIIANQNVDKDIHE